MTEENAIVVREMDATPKGAMRQATDVAGVCRDIVLKTAQNIQGRKYVKVEGWLALARAFGCTVGTRDVEKVDGGIRAMADVRRISDGAVIATAEGFVGDDEKMWQSRPMFARRAMAQTRAASRACRSAFSFVVVMIDSGLSTTPAEEMGADEASSPAPAQVEVLDPGPSTTVEARVAQFKAANGNAVLEAAALKGLTPTTAAKVKHLAKLGMGPEAA